MLEKIAEKSAQSLWRKLGEEALTKAVSTFASEGVKALIDIWKSKHMEVWKADFKEHHKARRDEAGDESDESESKESSEDPPKKESS